MNRERSENHTMFNRLSNAGKALVVASLLGLCPAPSQAQTPEERGYKALLTQPLETPLMTEKDYFDLWQAWPEPERSRAQAAGDAERRQMMLTRYGFQETVDRPGPIPQQFTPDGKGNLAMNCLACHGGPVGGKVVRGLGNSLIDLATFVEDLGRFYQGKGVTPPGPPAAAPDVPLPPTRGLSNAWGIALAYMVLRDRDLNQTNERQFPIANPGELDHPNKTPAFWLSKPKTRYYADGFVAKTHRDVMQFTFSYSMSRAQIMAQEDTFKDIFAWINSVPPPPYPFAIDRPLANRGRIVFLRDCASCHGTYGAGGKFPERIVPVDEVGTDPVRARDFSANFERHLGASWVGDYGKTPLFPQVGGYVAQPLDGVWATAPYLHNGSVPTLWHLLTPDARPAVWKRMSDAGYDEKRLGIEVSAFDALPEEASTEQSKRQFYRTDLRGLSNRGHRYPANGLGEQDKAALIEYLKTL